jgi:hypothetical protein
VLQRERQRERVLAEVQERVRVQAPVQVHEVPGHVQQQAQAWVWRRVLAREPVLLRRLERLEPVLRHERQERQERLLQQVRQRDDPWRLEQVQRRLEVHVQRAGRLLRRDRERDRQGECRFAEHRCHQRCVRPLRQ